MIEKGLADGGDIRICGNAQEAVQGADLVVTDTWVSMGYEETIEHRSSLRPYQVNESLMRLAAKDALFMHCLPAYRGKEVDANVIDGKNSVVWQEAENRLHVQKSILLWCYKK